METHYFALIFTIAAIVTLSSCATPYQTGNSDSGFGFHDVPVDSITYRVTFIVDNSSSAEVSDRYAFYRSAELTIQKGFDHFIVMDNFLDRRGAIATKTIRMFKGTSGPNDFATAYDANAIVKIMAPYVERQ